ncbi:glycosyltransferase [Eubacterium sp. MSJ-13]|uniref:glycosyltransferase family protein n=1 Tax=Eubacterium sp. MSJ-13 TaxID=2841513 RepID=UPI001C0F6B3F|nr:glycosyltransferase [Eubacterium sp. MSJ-13]MBU5477775.1 glycosyltransferase [Eubacterium sp. MSJ-13]
MIRFLIFEGFSQYGALHVMMDTLENYLKNNSDMEVCRINAEINGEIPEFWKEKFDYVFVVQAVWFERIYKNKKIFEIMNTKVLGWIVDPPYMHTDRVESVGKNMMIACVDGGDTEIVRKIYNKPAQTLHLFGIEYDHSKPICDRKICVLVPGSYRCVVEECEKEICKLSKSLKILIKSVIDKMIENCNQTIADAMRSVYRDLGLDITNEQIHDFMDDFGWVIDKYYRNFLREKCVLSMIKNGIKVSVCGMGWQKFKEKNKVYDNLEILGDDVSYYDVLKLMADSKIVLNISPFFTEGIHDRVSNAMLNGAICCTDRTEYLNENFRDREEILYYSWNRLDESIKRIKRILEDDCKLQNIADNAYKKAKQNLTVVNFTERIKDIYQNNFE